MNTLNWEWVFLGIAVFFCIFNILFFTRVRKIKVRKQEQIKQKKKLQQQIEQLEQERNQLDIQVFNTRTELNSINKDIETQKKLLSQRKEEMDNLNSSIIKRTQDITKTLQDIQQQQTDKTNKRLEDYKRVTKNAANMYIDTLQKDYKDAEARHKQRMTQINVEYNAAAADLQSLKQTRKAAYEAILKQKEVKQNRHNYCLIPSSTDLQDIHALQHIKQTLHKPRILSMLIWQTYWQPLAKEKFPIILQDKTKIGIYKITNIQTEECYIGQSLDIYKRWTDHCKAGLGIDTPAGNKLYKSIQEYGLENFTFELLCQCSKQQLNDKEAYFIELYQADLYGFNGQKGIK